MNPLRAMPTPAQHLLSLPAGTLPPNLRVQAEPLTFGIRRSIRRDRYALKDDEGEVISQLGKKGRRARGMLLALRER